MLGKKVTIDFSAPIQFDKNISMLIFIFAISHTEPSSSIFVLKRDVFNVLENHDTLLGRVFELGWKIFCETVDLFQNF